MRISKRISFSWSGVSAEWWLSLMHPERINAGFLFPFFLISLGFKSGAPFLPESARACQSYFEIFLTAEFADYADEIAKIQISSKESNCGLG